MKQYEKVDLYISTTLTKIKKNTPTRIQLRKLVGAFLFKHTVLSK